MVRLKAYTKYNENFFSDISIPYGAIKSNQLRLLQLCYKIISIPYGAIKRFF